MVHSQAFAAFDLLRGALGLMPTDECSSQSGMVLSVGVGTILTPHPKELERLIGDWRDDFEKIEKTRLFAKRYGVVIVVKGAYSLIVDSDHLYVNSSGTPALATAGSGDVLTGMIASLLAQGYKPMEAARVGVYLHGLTAYLTQKTINPRSFMAGDIISHIGAAYQSIEKKE